MQQLKNDLRMELKISHQTGLLCIG